VTNGKEAYAGTEKEGYQSGAGVLLAHFLRICMNSLSCEGPFILYANIWAVKLLVETLYAVWKAPHYPPESSIYIAYAYPS